MSEVRELPSREELLELFYYDDCLRWRKDKKKGVQNVKASERVVGCIKRHGYSEIMVNGVKYFLSRIVYQTVHGNLTPDLVIDHINRDRLDNRVENLRATSVKHNNRNQKKTV